MWNYWNKFYLIKIWEIIKSFKSKRSRFSKILTINENQFGHTRLAIIDLNEEANQPMIFDDIVLVFNGEIYNYKELIHVEQLVVKLKW